MKFLLLVGLFAIAYGAAENAKKSTDIATPPVAPSTDSNSTLTPEQLFRKKCRKARKLAKRLAKQGLQMSKKLANKLIKCNANKTKIAEDVAVPPIVNPEAKTKKTKTDIADPPTNPQKVKQLKQEIKPTEAPKKKPLTCRKAKKLAKRLNAKDVPLSKKLNKKIEKCSRSKVVQILQSIGVKKINITKISQTILKKINQTVVFKPSKKVGYVTWKKCAARITTEQNLKALKSQQHSKVKKIQSMLRELTAQYEDAKTTAKYHSKIASKLSRGAHTCQAMIISRLQGLYTKCTRHTQKVNKYYKYLCEASKGSVDQLWSQYKSHWSKKARKQLQIVARQPLPSNLTKTQMGCYSKCYKPLSSPVKQMKCYGDCVESPASQKLFGKTAYATMLEWVNKIRTCEKAHYAALAKVVKCVPWAMQNKADCPKTQRAIQVVQNWAQVQVWPF